MKEILKPIFIRGECKYTSPSVKEIASFCEQEKNTLQDETKRLFNPHKVYVDLSQRLYDTKTELLNNVNRQEQLSYESISDRRLRRLNRNVPYYNLMKLNEYLKIK